MEKWIKDMLLIRRYNVFNISKGDEWDQDVYGNDRWCSHNANQHRLRENSKNVKCKM